MYEDGLENLWRDKQGRNRSTKS